MTSPVHRGAGGAPAPRGAVDAAERYRRRLGRRVEVADDAVLLPLTGGLVAFEVPVHQARAVAGHLADLDVPGPALRTGPRGDRVAFLCDAEDLVFAQSDMPVGVVHLRAPTSLALPEAPASWFTAPDPDRRCLPTAAAVLHAVRRTVAGAARGVAHRAVGHPRAGSPAFDGAPGASATGG